MSTYSFTTSPGFTTNDNVLLIQSDVQSSFGNTLTSINTIGDCIELNFDTTLLPEDETLLRQIINDRDNRIIKTYIKTYYPEINNVSSTSYLNIGNFSYQGCKSIGELKGVDIMSNMDSGLTSYKIQIINRQDNSLVCSATLNNTNIQLNTLAIVAQPMEPCVLQITISVQKNPALTNVLYAHIQEINLWM